VASTEPAAVHPMIERPIPRSLATIALLLLTCAPSLALAGGDGGGIGDAGKATEDSGEAGEDGGAFAWESPSGIDSRDELKRWVPSFAFASGILVDFQEGWVTSNVRPSAYGSQDFVSPWVIGSGELMTPELLDVAGDPRLFVHGDVGVLIGARKDLAKEGDPSQPFEPPVLASGAPLPIFSDELILGSGSATRAQPGKLLLTAGAGVAFGWDMFLHPFRAKMSAEYLREEVSVSGIVKRAALYPPYPSTSYQFITLQDQADVVFHGIGPGIEIETDVVRWRSLIVGLGVSAQYYWIISDRKVHLEDSEDVDPTTSANVSTATAAWDYERGLHAFRTGISMRFRWVPLE